MKVVTVGLGYIGLPTAIMFANNGYKVTGIDINEQVINSLNHGKIHIEEPELQKEFEKAVHSDALTVQKEMVSGDVFIIAVPTPNQTDQYKSCDLSYVLSAVNTIIPHLKKGNTIIIESTIPPKTTETIILPLIEKNGFKVGNDIFLIHCPERVLPGQILRELKYNNRIIGGVTKQCTKKGIELYKSFVEGELIPSSAASAELAKLMENTFRDVNIALANELVRIGHSLQIDALEVIDMANRHPRVNIHTPGPGVGGHCLAVDPYFIVSKAPAESRLIQQARTINSEMPTFICQLINQMMQEVNGKKITILGITYKGNIDDIRESPAIEIINELKAARKYELSVYDPYVQLAWVERDFTEAVKNSDLLVVLADHDQFKTIAADSLKGMNHQIVFDTKNCIKNSNGMTLFNLGNTFTIYDRLKGM